MLRSNDLNAPIVPSIAPSMTSVPNSSLPCAAHTGAADPTPGRVILVGAQASPVRRPLRPRSTLVLAVEKRRSPVEEKEREGAAGGREEEGASRISNEEKRRRVLASSSTREQRLLGQLPRPDARGSTPCYHALLPHALLTGGEEELEGRQWRRREWGRRWRR
jgi:hypothetical protein